MTDPRDGLAGGNMGDEEESSNRICGTCGFRISVDENVCPRCGNVFRKEVGEWDWKRIPSGDELKKRPAQKMVDDGVRYH